MFPPQSQTLKPAPQCDGIGERVHEEVICHVLQKRPKRATCLFHLVRTQQKGGLLRMRKHVLTRHQICQHRVLIFPSLSNCEKHISVVYNAPSP